MYQAHNAYALKTKTELIDFLHRASFCPSVSIWTQAIDNNFFASWPGLTADAVQKFLPKSLATAKGHLNATQKNQQSTKIPPPSPTASTVMTTPTAPARATSMSWSCTTMTQMPSWSSPSNPPTNPN
jgi:hypothetical protein